MIRTISLIRASADYKGWMKRRHTNSKGEWNKRGKHERDFFKRPDGGSW